MFVLKNLGETSGITLKSSSLLLAPFGFGYSNSHLIGSNHIQSSSNHATLHADVVSDFRHANLVSFCSRFIYNMDEIRIDMVGFL